MNSKRPSLCMRWFGPNDPVKLADLRQIPTMTGVVSSVSHRAPGEPWSKADVDSLASEAAKHGLRLDVIESIPVSDEIKLGDSAAASHIEAWIASLEAVAAAGVQTVCYNFMPVADWLRTDTARPLSDGSMAMAYDDDEAADYERRLLAGDAEPLPAWSGFSREAFTDLRDRYARLGPDGLWKNLEMFLRRVVPAAEARGLRLGIHPDDPCWPVLGLPRIVTSPAAMTRICNVVDSPANGVTLCTGSLGCDTSHDLVRAASDLASRIAFMHARNVAVDKPGRFTEVAHPTACGNVNLAAVIKAAVRGGFEGPVRPDHGRDIWGETARNGYGLFDRALGATYIAGVLDCLGLDDHCQNGRST